MNFRATVAFPGNIPPSVQQVSTAQLITALPRNLNKVAHLDNLPFVGFDLWRCFDLSWLNGQGKPVVAIAEFMIPATSPNVIGSQSFKRYLGSFNQSTFESVNDIAAILARDLSLAAGEEVNVKICPEPDLYSDPVYTPSAKCIDYLDISIVSHDFKPQYLIDAAGHKYVSETLSSNLLKSNRSDANLTGWGQVFINYEGRKIEREKLLRYIISFGAYNGSCECCVERIFKDIEQYCHPVNLSVFARYTRAGGIDIMPFRSNFKNYP